MFDLIQRLRAALGPHPKTVNELADELGVTPKKVAAAPTLLEGETTRTTKGFTRLDNVQWGERLRRVHDALDPIPRSAGELAKKARLTENETRAAINHLRKKEITVWYSARFRGFWADGSAPPPDKGTASWASTRWKNDPPT